MKVQRDALEDFAKFGSQAGRSHQTGYFGILPETMTDPMEPFPSMPDYAGALCNVCHTHHFSTVDVPLSPPEVKDWEKRYAVQLFAARYPVVHAGSVLTTPLSETFGAVYLHDMILASLGVPAAVEQEPEGTEEIAYSATAVDPDSARLMDSILRTELPDSVRCVDYDGDL